MSVVLKWAVPVDGQPHLIGAGSVVLVANQGEHGTVYVWTWEYGVPQPTRSVVVHGTGHEVPEWHEHLGSCVAGTFVWHVFAEVPPESRLVYVIPEDVQVTGDRL